MKSVRLLFSLFPFAEELRPYGMAETASEFTVCLPPGFFGSVLRYVSNPLALGSERGARRWPVSPSCG